MDCTADRLGRLAGAGTRHVAQRDEPLIPRGRNPATDRSVTADRGYDSAGRPARPSTAKRNSVESLAGSPDNECTWLKSKHDLSPRESPYSNLITARQVCHRKYGDNLVTVLCLQD